eukprot:CAMPEP_0183378264 /NCGR_PEP_ID=MMETSP0164_2-20130417/124823_1 /TAXON_ID=221442 /ORGANISM="Coccolithus pelagicus ssp braarudi, Strain PLY182g" /LENGTH=143 /DNA_ID=CAMNT_0025555815 /DNA_START=825 /DNA_END=1257 /DNA_ORIENTATION=+
MPLRRQILVRVEQNVLAGLRHLHLRAREQRVELVDQRVRERWIAPHGTQLLIHPGGATVTLAEVSINRVAIRTRDALLRPTGAYPRAGRAAGKAQVTAGPPPSGLQLARDPSTSLVRAGSLELAGTNDLPPSVRRLAGFITRL